MTKKQVAIYAYLGIAVLFTIYLWMWGDTSHKGFAYNLGKGIVWPVVMFPQFGLWVTGLIIGLFVFIVLAVG